MKRILLITILTLSASAANAQSLQLSCDGIATSEDIDVKSGYAYDNNGNFASGSIYGSKKSSLSENLQIIINGNNGKIRLPPSLKPSLSGGQAGWYVLKSIEIFEDRITAKAKVNLISSTHIFINRLDGTVSLKTGAGTFSGKCSSFSIEDRKF